MDGSKQLSAIVTGGTAGLGLVIARTLAERGYSVTISGRDSSRLLDGVARLQSTVSGASIGSHCGDATSPIDASTMVADHVDRFGGLDVLVNVVGQSDRGRIDRLTVDRLRELIDVNVVASLVCAQAALPELTARKGTIVNIGSLASRVAPGYLGGYVIAKHALAGMTRQLRIECLESGVHVGLVCPGPIQRDDAGTRYTIDESAGIPASAAKPGGGAKIKGLPPEQVAAAVLRCIERREIEIVLPWKVRILLMLQTIAPRLADRWLS
jgi:uncharacterized protein